MSANVAGQGPPVVTIESNTVNDAKNGVCDAPKHASNGTTTITRRIHVKIQGSMSDFAQDGQGGATWRAVDGKQAAIWGLQDMASSLPGSTGSDTHASTTYTLSNAVMKSLVLLEHQSSFPMALGMTINGIPSTEMTSFGESYCYTVLPESNNTVPIKLYEADEANEEGMRWRKEYPKFNSSTLEKHGVLEIGDQGYLFVHQNHPSIALLRANKDLLGSDIDTQQKVDNEWYKVQKETFTACCNTLRTKVLSRFSTIDLNKFTVEASPVGTRDWLELQDGADILASFKPPPGASAEVIKELETKHLETICEKKCSYHARFEVTFEIQS